MSNRNRTNSPKTRSSAPAKPVEAAAIQQSAAAQKSYEALLEDIENAAEVETPRLDLFLASSAIQRQLEYLKDHGAVNEAIAIMAKAGVTSLNLMPSIRDASWALMHAVYMNNTTESLSDEIQVPVVLQEKSRAVRKRMLKVLDYHVGEDPEVVKVLEQMPKGKGYRSTAQGLWSLARLYQEHHATLAEDKTHYRRDDAATAIELGNQIMLELGLPKNQDLEFWRGQVSRIWALINQRYDKLQDVLRVCLGRDQEAALAPSLTILVRGRVSRSGTKASNGSNLPTPLPVPDVVPGVDPEVPADPQ